MTIRIIKAEEMRRVTEFMTKFEQASSFVKVDIDHATKTYERMIRRGSTTVMVMENNQGELIGAMAFIVAPDLHDGKLTAIETFWFMDPTSRGRGLYLFREFEKIAIEKGCEKLAMIHMMDSSPDRLERLYLRNGYSLAEKHYIKEI